MTLYKVLILDDKPRNEQHNSFQAIIQLSVEQRIFVDYYDTSNTLWTLIDNGDDVKLLKDFSLYKYVFIHYSFNDPIIGENVMVELIDKLSETSKVVLFSGNRLESETPIEKLFNDTESKSSHFEIKRNQYFNNLGNFIDSYLASGQYQIKYLYNPYVNPKKDKAYALFEIIKTDLEESIQSAIESNSFIELLSLYSYKNTPEISNRFLNMTDDEFIENLEDFIENN